MSYRMSRSGRSSRGARGQSSVLGYTLVLAMSLVAVSGVVILGAAALSDTQRSASIEQAEHVFTQVDAQASQVALGSSTVQTIDPALPGGGTSVVVREDAGWLRIRTHAPDGSDETILNTTMGAMTYERDGTTVAYQGGGVWVRNAGGSRMVSPPGLHYRHATLTLPLIQVTSGSAGGGPVVVRDGGRTQHFPDATQDRRNPLPNGTVTITVDSDYYRSWADYLTARTDSEVIAVDHATGRVTAELTVPTEPIEFEGALTATGNEMLRLETSGSADVYNSRVAPYDAATAEPAPILTDDDVKIEDDIQGDVYAAGDITVDGATLEGDACAEGTITNSGTITGWTNDTTCDVEIRDYPVPDAEIDNEVGSHDDPSTNNNSDTTCISGEEVVGDCTGTDALTAGTYFLANGTIHNRTIDVNTSDGPVDIVVDDQFKIAGTDTEIDIVNDDPSSGVTFYVDGRFKVEGQSSAGPNVSTDANQTADLLSIKVASGNDVKFEKESRLVGTVYAPGSGCGSETVRIETGAEIFGAVLVECPDNVETVGSIHYDEDLATAEGGGIAITHSISYLHVSVNEIQVTT